MKYDTGFSELQFSNTSSYQKWYRYETSVYMENPFCLFFLICLPTSRLYIDTLITQSKSPTPRCVHFCGLRNSCKELDVPPLDKDSNQGPWLQYHLMVLLNLIILQIWWQSWFNYWFSFTLAYSRISHEYPSLFIIVINLIFVFALMH